MTEELKFEDVLELIKECSHVGYVTIDTSLDDLDLDPKDVIRNAIRDNLFTLNLHEKDYELHIDDDSASITMTVSLSNLPFPIEDIVTIEDLAVFLSGMEEDIEEMSYLNNYDLILDYGNTFFTLQNSEYYAKVDASKFLKVVKERYGVQIEKASITKFNGTVEELCHSLTDRINRALKFQTK